MRITERQLRAIIKEQYREIISEMTREDHYNSLVAKKERVQDEIDRIEDETDVPPPSGYDSEPQSYDSLLAWTLSKNTHYQGLKRALEKVEGELSRVRTQGPSKSDREKEAARQIRSGEKKPMDANNRAARIASQKSADITESLGTSRSRTLRRVSEKFSRSLLEADEEPGDTVKSFQDLVNNHDFLKTKGITVKQEDLIEGGDYVLMASDDALGHIKNRHMNASVPGSLFDTGVDLKEAIRDLLGKTPSETAGGRVKWLGVDTGSTVGKMGVAHTDNPEEIEKMEDHTMTDGAKETVKKVKGSRKDTSEMSLITSLIGDLPGGKKALSLITAFPGGSSVDGQQIPANRGDFTKNGFYFIVEGRNHRNAITEGSTPDAESFSRWQLLAGILKG